MCPDEDGIDLIDPNTAYLEGYRAACEIWGELLLVREDPTLYTFEIRDAAGELHFELPFLEVLAQAKIGRPPTPLAALPTILRERMARGRTLTDEISVQLESARSHLTVTTSLLASLATR